MLLERSSVFRDVALALDKHCVFSEFSDFGDFFRRQDPTWSMKQIQKQSHFFLRFLFRIAHHILTTRLLEKGVKPSKGMGLYPSLSGGLQSISYRSL